jgi:hypothetical protein
VTGEPIFQPAHSAALLAYVASVDDRFATTDEAVAAARVRAWQTILSDVDPGFALQHARRYYSKVGQPRLTPAEVRNAWVQAQRRQEQRERPPLAQGVQPAPRVRDYLRAVVAAVAAGRDPGSITPPAGATLTPEADVASRRCANWRNCACDHTGCRDGWLDAEERVTNSLGKSYPAVTHCPHCRDAALMAAELATPVRGRRR